MKKLFFLLAVLTILAGTAAVFAREIEADPSKEYHVNPEAGPWMICAASFTGTPAPQLAHDLVLEIRQSFGLPAYIFDRGKEEKLKQQEQIRKIRENSPPGTKVRVMRVEEQYAVLVGGYPDMETARKNLDRIKMLKPSDKFRETVSVGDLNRGGQPVQRAYISPFLNAFVAHNPSIPLEKPTDDPLDYSFLKKLNGGESYSLLKCRKPVTLLVKSFQGAYVIQPQNKKSTFMDLIGLGSRSGELLGAGGLQAHALAELLHKMKPSFEAYVLHTRNYSFVSVGGYDGPDDPKLKQMQQMLSRLQLGGLGPDMQLFAQPLPMQVPQPK